MKYRSELDGLRALAVLPVIFFMQDLKYSVAALLVLMCFLLSVVT